MRLQQATARHILFATYNPAICELIYINSGYNAPFLIRRESGTFQVQRLETDGPVIGLLPSVFYEEQHLILVTGHMLLTYTDGISEAMTLDDEEWGKNVCCLLRRHCMMAARRRYWIIFFLKPTGSQIMRRNTMI